VRLPGATAKPSLFPLVGVNRAWVLKNAVKRISFGWEFRHVLRSPQLSGSFPNGCCRLAEEAHQSLDVLGRRCKEELLPNELHPT
jgi:hypothetical protein